MAPQPQVTQASDTTFLRDTKYFSYTVQNGELSTKNANNSSRFSESNYGTHPDQPQQKITVQVKKVPTRLEPLIKTTTTLMNTGSLYGAYSDLTSIKRQETELPQQDDS